MTQLRVKYVATGDLIPYVNNARTHDDIQIAQIAASIKEFGFNVPVAVDAENTVLCGHARLRAAQKLGLEKIPTVCLSHLNENQRKAYILADNRIALNSGWDTDLLKTEINGLFKEDYDLHLLGFEDREIAALLKEMNEVDVEGPDEEEDEIKIQYLTCPHCKKEFEKGQAKAKKK